MTDDAILKFLEEKHPGLTLGLRRSVRMVQRGDTIKWERPPGLTPYGDALLAFARDLLGVSVPKCENEDAENSG